MAIKDFLRKIFSSEKEKPEPEKLRFPELEDWLNKRKAELERKESQVTDLVKSRLKQLISETEHHVQILETINLENKKVEDKIKFIVKENLFHYIKYLKSFIETLSKLEDKNFLESLNRAFSDFNRKSEPAFQKATFLIGKELGDVKQSISNFFKDSKTILDENKDLNNSAILKQIENKFNSVQNTEKSEKQIANRLAEIESNLKDKANAIKILENEIENARKTEKYLANLKKIEENEKSREEIKKQAIKLREIIDFKNLAGIFHTNEKKMRQIKEYNENFLSAIENDRGAGLISLLEEIKNHEASEKLRELIRKQEELNNFRHENETSELELSMSRINSEIESLKNEKSRIEKAGEKQGETKKSMISEIKQELEKINVILSEES